MTVAAPFPARALRDPPLRSVCTLAAQPESSELEAVAWGHAAVGLTGALVGGAAAPGCCRLWGLTRAIELTTAASAASIPVFPHGRSLVPAIHLAAAFPHTVGALEYRLQWEPQRQQSYVRPCLPRHGEITISGAPGLGTTPRSR